MASNEVIKIPLDANGFPVINLGAPATAQSATYTDNVTSPLAAGTAAPGASLLASPADHVHPATPSTDTMLVVDPAPSTDITYTPTYSSGKVTVEEWKFTVSGLKIKTIDYTYSSGRVATEVRKVFAPDGTTVIAQITITYSYSGSTLNAASQVRNV